MGNTDDKCLQRLGRGGVGGMGPAALLLRKLAFPSFAFHIARTPRTAICPRHCRSDCATHPRPSPMADMSLPSEPPACLKTKLVSKLTEPPPYIYIYITHGGRVWLTGQC